MGTATPEGAIKTAICWYLHTRRDLIQLFWVNASVGIYDPVKKLFRKPNSPFQIKGTSDILGILKDGRMLAIEVKSKRGYPSIEQKIFLEEINIAKGVAFLARSVEDVKENLSKVKLNQEKG